MNISYKINTPISGSLYIEILKNSGLGKRRPIDDEKCIEGMISNSNLLVSAWVQDELVGIARSITDFNFACYLSDLAVKETYQNMGIGKQLQILTQEQLGRHCMLVLLAAPNANSYYEHIGFTHNPRCWVLARGDKIR